MHEFTTVTALFGSSTKLYIHVASKRKPTILEYIIYDILNLISIFLVHDPISNWALISILLNNNGCFSVFVTSIIFCCQNIEKELKNVYYRQSLFKGHDFAIEIFLRQSINYAPWWSF